MELKRKIAAVVASGALLISSFATPALAGTTIEISGNSTYSDNTANVTTTNNTTVVQDNNANITNNVNVDADTGHNDANDNTGGDVTVKTGNVDTDVSVSNTVNSNSASVDCCPTGDTSVLISGNGSNSDNDVNLGQTSTTNLFQDNNAKIYNNVKVDGDTGKNDANDNTGGSVTIETGDVDTKVNISNAGNVNSAQVGNGTGGGGSVSAWIIGNATHSDNTINLGLSNSTLLSQSNNAYIKNHVDVDADTGKNDANDNTGGDVMIDTGNVDVEVGVDNMVNFNVADVDCVCLLSDLLAKIAGNGSNSDNDINAKLDESLSVFQDNCGKDQHELNWGHHKKCALNNDVDVDGDTGKNDAEDNTGDPDGDPSVETGDVDAMVDLKNSGNVNVLGDSGDLELPDFDLGFDLSLHLDLSDLLMLLGLG